MDSPLIGLTGASGFLGSHIADALLMGGWRVRAAVRPTSNLRWLQGKSVELRETDLANDESCAAFVRGVQGVVHCAGLVSASTETAYLRANADTTATLLEAARAAWTDEAGSGPYPVFLLVSSLAAHGPASLERPAREDDPCRPVTAYGRSKLAAERLVQSGEWPFRTAILRPPALYGPRDRSFLPLVRWALRGWTVRIAGPMTGLSLVDGRDAARAVVALLASPTAAGVFFVDDGQGGYTWADLARALGAAAGRSVRTLTVPLWPLKGTAAILRPLTGGSVPVLRKDRILDLEGSGWACDGVRLREATGFTARYRAAAGLADALAFYKEQGWL